MSGRLWRYTRRLLIGTAFVAYGAHVVLSPDSQFDETRDYTPTPVQQEVLKLLAKKHDYVALGDTNHMRTEITMLAQHPRTIEALHQGGVKNYFLELNASRQPEINEARLQERPAFNFAAGSDWVCLDKQKKALNGAFNQNLKAFPAMRFIAADERWHTVDPLRNMSGVERNIYTKSIGAYYWLYGCIAPGAFLLPYIFISDMEKKLMGGIADDRQTVQGMKAYNGKSAILYGAGHFGQQEGSDTTMRTLLQTNGKKLAVVEVFADIAEQTRGEKQDRQTEEKKGVALSKPDIIFLVTPSAFHPDGVQVVNPAYQAIYDQAVKNASRPVRLSMR